MVMHLTSVANGLATGNVPAGPNVAGQIVSPKEVLAHMAPARAQAVFRQIAPAHAR